MAEREGYHLITGPTAEPITLDEAKEHLRVEVAEEDGRIAGLILGARRAVENLIGRVLISQTWERTLDTFPAGAIELQLGPVQSVTAITYTDLAGDPQTVPAEDYNLDAARRVPLVWPGYGLTWPSSRCYPGAVRVRYVAGYTPETIPDDIREAMLVLIADLYEHRGDASPAAMDAVLRFLSPHRVHIF